MEEDRRERRVRSSERCDNIKTKEKKEEEEIILMRRRWM